MILAAVQRLHRRGLSVFPVSLETKTPLVAWGRLQTARPTMAEVSEWFSTNSRAVGVAMGPVSGKLLVDFDFSKGPEARAFFDAHRWPRTWTERTKSGGLHLYFSWTAELDTRKTNTTGLIAKNVDTKGAGGYSKMAPSAGYRWIRPPHLTPLAEPPAWLVAMLQSRERQVLIGGTNWLKELVARGLQPGTRNHDLTRLAGSLRGRGYDVDAIKFFLSGPASAAGIPESELSAICNSAGRYTPNGVEGMGGALQLGKFLQDAPPVEWLCRPFFARGMIHFVAGLPKTMKTWLMMDLALEMARGGGKWCGMFPVVGGPVLFIDQERSAAETSRRLSGMAKGKSIKADTIPLHVWCEKSIKLTDDQSYERFRKELTQIQPAAVIIDSFVTAYGGDENNRYEVNRFFERVKAVRTEFNTAVVFIDHERKSTYNDKADGVAPSMNSMVGSVAKSAALESCMMVHRHDSKSSFVYHTGSTLADTAAPFMVSVKDREDGSIAVEGI